MSVVTVRYFAAAAEAVGTSEETYHAESLGGLRESMAQRHGPAIEPVFARCAWLVAGERADDPTLTLADGASVDLLPPFAGG
ncbi:MAG: molybdopterin synthase sulfur carrier subunit [Actinobacteria bacterium HGW-Actinobacteria-4]|nr:MAG: molybdopterin synthase sulfur carrier subunit [Actinobacteria bacterium HGW-Actinobacteria-4]